MTGRKGGLTVRLSADPPRFHVYVSREGTQHLITPWANFCLTCSRSDHPLEFSAEDNRDWVAGKWADKDWQFCQLLDDALGGVGLVLTLAH
jgi:hypothetical protein